MKYFSLLLFSLFSLYAGAQKVTVTGTVSEASTGETLPGATALLLSPKDSSQVTGGAANMNGVFTLPAVKAGRYLLKVSYMGYQTLYRDLTLSSRRKTEDLGKIQLLENAKIMKEAVVEAQLAQVEMKEDTFVYNAGAFRTPEGSMLEDLVKKLPGAEVDDNGNITINGKTVKKIMVDGKEFFSNDTKMAMKNLPTKMVEKIKSYERKSDYSRVTGIDDGDEETVLDLTVKKGMKEGWLINADGAYGTEDRYTAKLSVNRFMDNYHFSVIGSANNVNDRSMGGWGGRGGRGGGGGGGIVSSQMAGVNFAWENGKKENEAGLLKTGGNVRFSRTDTDNSSTTNSQTFLSGSSRWNNSFSASNPINWNLNADFRLEWKPDSMTNLIFRPSFSHSDSDSEGESESVTFNKNPYDYMKDPLREYLFWDDPDKIRVNSNHRTTASESVTNSGNGDFQVNRRLGKPGRNITLNAAGGYSRTSSESRSLSLVNYYQEENKAYNYTKQHNINPSESWNVRGRLSYTEPITKELNLQASYQFQYRFSDSDRGVFSVDSTLTRQMIRDMGLTAEDLYLGRIPGIDTVILVQDWINSQYATYNEYNHDANLMVRYNKKFQNEQELRINGGISFQPQTTHLDYMKNLIDTVITRQVYNWSPRLDMRWRISKTSQMRVRYNGYMSQPSMTNLIEVIDNSNKQNVTAGNAGLESSWTNNFNLFYNDYKTEKQMGWSAFMNYSMTNRSISTATIYDDKTGNRYSRPMNIDGNWNIGANLMFNSALGSQKRFNINTHTVLSHSNSVGYISSSVNVADYIGTTAVTDIEEMTALFEQVPLQKATTKTTNVGETLRLNYRMDYGEIGTLEVGVNGGFNYQHARNDLQPKANLDTWNFNYGGNLLVTLPWDMTFSTDIGPQYRRGYDDESMNTTELIWNAQLSQNFRKWLHGHDLAVSIQWFDILQERSNISRSISATQRSDTYTNTIHSYLLFHLIYKLNLLGNSEARAAMGPRGPLMTNAEAGRAGREGRSGSGGGGAPGGGGFGGGGGGRGR